MTIFLPPSHASMFGHRLFSVLPKNRYSKEYITCAEVMGGSKTWTGVPKRLKVSAEREWMSVVQC